MIVSDAAMDARARRAAKRAGLLAKKSRNRLHTDDTVGGYTLIDPMRNAVLAGERCDLTAEKVIEVCS